HLCLPIGVAVGRCPRHPGASSRGRSRPIARSRDHMPNSAVPPLDGKVALVTGAARKIGRAIALALAADGARVVVHTRSSAAEAEGVVAEITRAGGTAELALSDITDEAAVRAMVDGIAARHGRLDVLVNNAAIRAATPFLEMTLAQWRQIMTTI